MCVYLHYHSDGEKELREQHQKTKQTHTDELFFELVVPNSWHAYVTPSVTPPEFDMEPENDCFQGRNLRDSRG